MDQPDDPTPTEPTPTDGPATDAPVEETPPAEAGTTEVEGSAGGAPSEAGSDAAVASGSADRVEDEAPPVEATVPAEEPADGVPTPLAAPAEGPASAVAHDVSARPKPAMAKVTPVLAAVAVAWVLKKLLTRNRS